MSIRSMLVAALGLFTLTATAGAAPGDTPTRPGGDEPPTLRDRSNPAGETIVGQRQLQGSVGLEGKVVDSAGKAIEGVQIKVFADGMTVTATTSAADGTFRLDANPMQRPNGSAVVWFQAPDPAKYVDTELVLWESAAAKEHHLFSACTRSLEGGAAGTLEVTLRSADEQQAAVVASKCLAGS